MRGDIIPLRSELAYLLPPADFWWQWTPDERWIQWSDGRTIVARRELQDLLERLAPRGLPPLGSILLIIAATRQNWDAAKAESLLIGATVESTLCDGKTLVSMVDAVTRSRVTSETKSIVADLAIVADLPATLRESVAAKIALLDFVLDRQLATVGADTASAVVGLLDRDFERPCVKERSEELLRRADADFAALRVGLARLQSLNVESWLLTGLNAPVKPADIEVPLATRIRELIRTVRNDAELGGVAALASQVLAAVSVPRRLRAHEDLPLGGVSDISNRGSLDRLLLSELANDPTTLAVRVAMNEALYIRRESPTRHPPTARLIVIDGGIRMWGVPRVFATAVALALAGSTDHDAFVTASRTKQTGTVSVDLGSESGLREHLASLDPWPDPTDGFLARIDSLTRRPESDARLEAFLITDESTLSDPASWQRLTPAMRNADLYIATVSRDGGFELLLASPQGRRLICSARLALDSIVARPTSPTGHVSLLDRDPSLPLIVRLQHFPLLLPATLDTRFAVYTPETGLVGLAEGGRLMRWTGEPVGGRQLIDALPSGQLRGVFADAERRRIYVVITRRKQSKMIVLQYDLETAETRTVELGVAPPLDLVYHQGVFLIIHKHGFSVLHPETGQIVPRSVPNRCYWLAGRFFLVDDQLLAASDAGLFSVCKKHRPGSLPFDRAPGEGPWVVTRDLQLQSADGKASLQRIPKDHGLAHPPHVHVRVSMDGERILLEPRHGLSRILGIHLETGESQPFQDAQAAYGFIIGEVVSWTKLSGITLRRHLNSIAVTADGDIAVQTRSVWRRFRTDIKGSLCLEAIAESFEPLRAPTSFTQTQRVSKTRQTLRKAVWAEGSSAWLDSRGLLHLKSSDKGLPEISLVLNDAGVSGWSSEGETFGWRCFLGGEATITGVQALALIRAFARRL